VWTSQYAIAVVFLSAGYMKTTMAMAQLSHIIPWTSDAPPWFVRTIGLIDLTGGLGLLLPAWTRILPGLTVPAALGCATVLVLAVAFHAYRGEALGVVVNLPLAAIAAFLLWARWKRVPIASRGEQHA